MIHAGFGAPGALGSTCLVLHTRSDLLILVPIFEILGSGNCQIVDQFRLSQLRFVRQRLPKYGRSSSRNLLHTFPLPSVGEYFAPAGTLIFPLTDQRWSPSCRKYTQHSAPPEPTSVWDTVRHLPGRSQDQRSGAGEGLSLSGERLGNGTLMVQAATAVVTV